MKKLHHVILALLISALSLSGCDNEQSATPLISSENLAKVENNTESIERKGSYTVETNNIPHGRPADISETPSVPPAATLAEIINDKPDGNHGDSAMIVVPEPQPPFRVGEEVIDFLVEGDKVVGTLTVPQGKKPAPVILLLHGYTGHREADLVSSTNEGIFRRTARLWAEQGYASLRMDFRGSGDSRTKDFPWAKTTFESQIADAVAAVSFLQLDKRVDGNRIAVVGWSQGGLIAAGLAGRTPQLRAVGLWNAVTIAPETFAGILGGVQILRGGLSAGDKLVGETNLKGHFFEGIYSIDPVAEIARYRGPLFVSAGTRDSVVAPQPYMGNLLLKYHEGDEEIWVRPMDHWFDTQKSATLFDEMVGATLAFLRKGLG